jgi:hypothetical protein
MASVATRKARRRKEDIAVSRDSVELRTQSLVSRNWKVRTGHSFRWRGLGSRLSIRLSTHRPSMLGVPYQASFDCELNLGRAEVKGSTGLIASISQCRSRPSCTRFRGDPRSLEPPCFPSLAIPRFERCGGNCSGTMGLIRKPCGRRLEKDCRVLLSFGSVAVHTRSIGHP